MDMLLLDLPLLPLNPGLQASPRLRANLTLLLRSHLRRNHNGAMGQMEPFLCLGRDGSLPLNRSSQAARQGCSMAVAFMRQREARGISSINRHCVVGGGMCEGSGLASLPKTIGGR